MAEIICQTKYYSWFDSYFRWGWK